MYLVYYCLFKNNKGYVGLTSQKLNTRIKKHINSSKNGSNVCFHRAIRKYNYDFEVLVLAEGLSKEQAISLEINSIKTLKTHNKYKLGYNSTTGGEGVNNLLKNKEMRDVKSFRCNKEFIVLKNNIELSRHYNQTVASELYKIPKNKISMCLYGKRRYSNGYEFRFVKNPILFVNKPKKDRVRGLKRSEKTCQNISRSLKGLKKSNIARRNMSIAKKGVSIKKSSKSMKGRINIARAAFNKTLIVTKDLDFYKKYLSILECSIDLNLNKNSIASCVIGKRNSLFGYKFSIGDLTC